MDFENDQYQSLNVIFCIAIRDDDTTTADQAFEIICFVLHFNCDMSLETSTLG